MSTNTAVANTTFIDLGTFSELEGFLYGGPEAVTWFVGSVTKSNWFSFIPVSLRHAQVPDFGQRNVPAKVNRSADYSLGCWFRTYVPQLGYAAGTTGNLSIRWVKNFMHNLFERVQVYFNELIVQEFSNYWLDANAAYRVPASKAVGYKTMIGTGILDQVATGASPKTGFGFFQIPLPLFWSEDSGVALPIAALPFNEVTIQYTFRRWQELVVLGDGVAAQTATISSVIEYDPSSGSARGEPQLKFAETFSHHVVVHNDERVKMGDAPRDIVISQVQEISPQPFKDVSTPNRFDIRLSHAITSTFWMAENRSWFDAARGQFGRVMSNYSTAPSDRSTGDAYDPIAQTSLYYESTMRYNMGTDYFSLMVPFLFSTAVPEADGYHMQTYSLDPWCALGAKGSTNFSKLSNVAIQHDSSQVCINAANGLGSAGGAPVADGGVWGNFPAAMVSGGLFRQTFYHIYMARNLNIVRLANGSLGQPAL